MEKVILWPPEVPINKFKLVKSRRKASVDCSSMPLFQMDAQRRAMGLPEGADIEEGFDPFENQSGRY